MKFACQRARQQRGKHLYRPLHARVVITLRCCRLLLNPQALIDFTGQQAQPISATVREPFFRAGVPPNESEECLQHIFADVIFEWIGLGPSRGPAHKTG